MATPPPVPAAFPREFATHLTPTRPGVVRHAEGPKSATRHVDRVGQVPDRRPVGPDRQDQRGSPLLGEPGLDPLQSAEDHHAEGRRGQPEAELPTPEAEPHHGDEPERRRGRYPHDQVPPLQDHAPAEEPDPRQDPQRQGPQDVDGDERTGGFPAVASSRFVWIIAREAARQTSRVVRRPAGRPCSPRSMPTSAGDDRQRQPQRDVLPRQVNRHPSPPIAAIRAGPLEPVGPAGAGHASGGL